MKEQAIQKLPVEDQVYRALLEYKEPKYARQSLGMTVRAFDKVVNDFRIPLDIGLRNEKLIAIASILSDEINQLTTQAVPEDLTEQMEKCYKAHKEDDLIGGLIDTVVEFGVEGFTTKVKKDADQKKLDAFNTKYDIDSVVMQLYLSSVRTGNILLGWQKKKKNDIGYVMALDPRIHKVLPTNKAIKGKPQKVAFRKDDDSASKEITALLKASRKPGESAKLGRPKKNQWQPVKEPEFVECRTYDGFKDRMVTPPMARIFPDYELRKLIKDGDFTIFFHLKQMIHQIKLGETANNVKPWMTIKAPSETECDNILAKYKNSDKTMMEVTSAMYEHVFVAPDSKYFDGTKYQEVDKRIIRWANALALYSDGDKYAGGFLKLKALRASIRRRRRCISSMLREFYEEALGIEDVFVLWNEHNLLEPSQLLARLNASINHGLSNTSFLQELGFNAELEVRQLNVERDDIERWQPLFEPSQGLLPGAPKNPDTIDDRSPAPTDE